MGLIDDPVIWYHTSACAGESQMLGGLRRKDAAQCVPQQVPGEASSFKEDIRADLIGWSAPI